MQYLLGEGTCQDLSVEVILPGGHFEIVDVTSANKDITNVSDVVVKSAVGSTRQRALYSRRFFLCSFDAEQAEKESPKGLFERESWS